MGVLGNLRDTLRKLAYTTSVDQLHKQGVRQVNVLGLDRIAALIEEAVDRSLKNRLMGLERAQVADATREEFLRLLQSNANLQRSHDEALRLKQRAEEELDAIRRQLGEARQTLDARLSEATRDMRATHEGEDELIRARITEILAIENRPDLQDRVAELVLDVVGRERATTIQARQSAHSREVELLERRIGKLSRSLEESERRLSHIASVKQIDGGISSIYREAQGLDHHDGQFERKRDLMANIFAANLALQKRTSAAHVDEEKRR